jgi:Alcohol dehydrogenase GroES-associated
MRGVVFNGIDDVRVETVPDPSIREPTDAIVRVAKQGFAERTCTSTTSGRVSGSLLAVDSVMNS